MQFAPGNRSGVLAALMVVAAACSSPPAASSGSSNATRDAGGESRSAALGDTVAIELGRTASVDGGRLALRFVSRGPDSRCPANVVCVWMGDVAARITARAGNVAVERELHTGIEPRSFTMEGYVVTIVGLLPYPGAETADTPGAKPTVLVRVTR